MLSVAALIIVFAVEQSWFSDNYNQAPNYYGLWRLCLFANRTCDSWFSSNGPLSAYIEARHNRDRSERSYGDLFLVTLDTVCCSRDQCMASVGDRLLVSHNVHVDYCFRCRRLLSTATKCSLLSSDPSRIRRLASR